MMLATSNWMHVLLRPDRSGNHLYAPRRWRPSSRRSNTGNRHSCIQIDEVLQLDADYSQRSSPTIYPFAAIRHWPTSSRSASPAQPTSYSNWVLPRPLSVHFTSMTQLLRPALCIHFYAPAAIGCCSFAGPSSIFMQWASYLLGKATKCTSHTKCIPFLIGVMSGTSLAWPLSAPFTAGWH